MWVGALSRGTVPSFMRATNQPSWYGRAMAGSDATGCSCLGRTLSPATPTSGRGRAVAATSICPWWHTTRSSTRGHNCAILILQLALALGTLASRWSEASTPSCGTARARIRLAAFLLASIHISSAPEAQLRIWYPLATRGGSRSLTGCSLTTAGRAKRARHSWGRETGSV